MSEYEKHRVRCPSHAVAAQPASAGQKTSLRSRVKSLLNGKLSHSVRFRRKSLRITTERNVQKEVTLERVHGITAFTGSGLACDPNSGVVAYPAGCVVVILHPKDKTQRHILNTSRKDFSALAFSKDGKYLVTGERGHRPSVRVWDVCKAAQVAEEQCHQSGVTCVAFSPSGRYVVSAGSHQDLSVSVWDWRKGVVIASNKVFSKVLALSFSEDGGYFVTAGNRTVKFWYLDASGHGQVNSTVPLIGRSALLGEQWNNTFCGVACGLSHMASNTYCITSRGLLCLFNSKRLLEAWIDIQTTSALCLSVSEDYIFCGCTDATVRVFNPLNLCFITTLPQPWTVGMDLLKVAHAGNLFDGYPESSSSDTIALTFDPLARHLTCVYSDHSVCVWDVCDIQKVGMVYSTLYHSGSVWSVETYPEAQGQSEVCLPGGCFLTCSSDSTIRLWCAEPSAPCCHASVTMVYTGMGKQQGLEGDAAGCRSPDEKSGVRMLRISPHSLYLAAGDWTGTVCVFSLPSMDEVLHVKAHGSEVLCLDFSPPVTGSNLLVSAGRDGFIHIFDIEKQWLLVETLCEHSTPVTCVRFSGADTGTALVCCGEQSLSLYSAEKSMSSKFSHSRRVRVKATLNDMDLDATLSHSVTSCNDGNIRVYSLKSGKVKKCFRGCLGDDVRVLRVHMDPSGTFTATISSDNSICIFEYGSGECVASMFAHSGVVTGMRFSHDCQRFITVSEDGSVLVWLLTPEMTDTMRKNLRDIRQKMPPRSSAEHPPPSVQAYSEGAHVRPKPDENKLNVLSNVDEEERSKTAVQRNGAHGKFIQTPVQRKGSLPVWARRLVSPGSSTTDLDKEQDACCYQPQGKWAEHLDTEGVLLALETQSQRTALTPSPERDREYDPYPKHDESLYEEREDIQQIPGSASTEAVYPLARYTLRRSSTRADFLLPSYDHKAFSRTASSGMSNILCPPDTSVTSGEGEHDVQNLHEFPLVCCQEKRVKVDLSLDSACGMGSAGSQTSDQDQTLDGALDSFLGEMQFPGHDSSNSTCFLSQLRLEKRDGRPPVSTVLPGKLLTNYSKGELKSPGKGHLFRSAGDRQSPLSQDRRTTSSQQQSLQGSKSQLVSPTHCCTGTTVSSHGNKPQSSSVSDLKRPMHKQATMLTGQRSVSTPDLERRKGCRQSMTTLTSWSTLTTIPTSPGRPPAVDKPPFVPHSPRAGADLSRPSSLPLQRLSRKSWHCSASQNLAHAFVGKSGEGDPNRVRKLEMTVTSSTVRRSPSFSEAPVVQWTPVSKPVRCACIPGSSHPAVMNHDRRAEAQSHLQFSHQSSCFSDLCPGDTVHCTVVPREDASFPSPVAVNGAVNLSTCKQVVRDLEHSVKMAVGLYKKLTLIKQAPEQHFRMRSVLTDAFREVRRDLDGMWDTENVRAVPRQGDEAEWGRGHGSAGRVLRDSCCSLHQ